MIRDKNGLQKNRTGAIRFSFICRLQSLNQERNQYWIGVAAWKREIKHSRK